MSCVQKGYGGESLFLQCRSLQLAADNKEKAAQAQKAKAGAMKMALQTIGKFNIKKKVGQNNQIFGRYAITHSVLTHTDWS